MLDDIAQENQVVMREFVQQRFGVADVEVVVEITVHRGQVGAVAFDAVYAHTPLLALVTGRVVLSLVDVGIFPKEMAPLAEADTDVEDRFRFELSNQMNDSRD